LLVGLEPIRRLCLHFVSVAVFMQVLDLLTPIVQDSKVGIDLAGFAAVALGLIYVGSCNEDVAQSIVLALMERSEAELGEPLARFLCLGLGLLYLGKQVLSLLSV
jgi:26S proteasome regulatory subunit N1